ncbi:cell surface protein [Mollisia scopiformis]|uniref:Cell surface protein n=1 Tax=Mollisia scopiformis TaxID=149040 RepID=A0A194X160_MOLSC|nr:cell surface protein [Mollisia scopiformis]KUJ13928.1 cell surface protein [Mollisia scopiformis]
MFAKIFLVALAASPLVAAHGKVSVVTGDAGGNTTALGIQGGVVPGAGQNDKTEVDTTIFNQLDAASDGLGRTEGQGKNTLDGMTDVVAQSGSTLPQVSSSGGSLSGTLHIVTTDGAGPYTAIVDPTGTGSFASGTEAEVTQQVPGTFGEILPNGNTLRLRMLAKMGLAKRAQNVNKDYPFSVAIPAGTTCTGTVGGQSGVCLVKMANPNPAGPFGGVFAMQVASGAGNSTSTTSAKTAKMLKA